ncbi:unnamed protein product, partial [Sphacelaria rigidula]
TPAPTATPAPIATTQPTPAPSEEGFIILPIPGIPGLAIGGGIIQIADLVVGRTIVVLLVDATGIPVGQVTVVVILNRRLTETTGEEQAATSAGSGTSRGLQLRGVINVRIDIVSVTIYRRGMQVAELNPFLVATVNGQVVLRTPPVFGTFTPVWTPSQTFPVFCRSATRICEVQLLLFTANPLPTSAPTAVPTPVPSPTPMPSPATNTPGNGGNRPGNGGNRPGNGGNGPGNGGNGPGNGGDAPGNSGDAPGNSGDAPGNSGDAPGNSGDAPGNSGDAPGNSGDAPGNSGDAPGNS